MRSRTARLLTGALLAAAALPAAALYKIVQPDGSITYTDRPPPDTTGRVITLGRSAQPQSSEAALPTELRQVSQRYPVVLYTAPDCAPCAAGRRLLQQRGVPYTERIIASEDDAVALERAVGGRTVPALAIGSQPLRGLSETDWTAFLDAAGYPRESRLPPGWQPPAATPLVERPAERNAPANDGETQPARPQRSQQPPLDAPQQQTGKLRF